MSARMHDPADDPRSRRRWALRIGIAVASWLVIVVFLRLGEMDVRVVLMATLAAAIAACSWLALDLEPRSQPVTWHVSAPTTTRSRGDDHRMRQFERQLREHVEGRQRLRSVHAAMVELTDERVRTTHGVDRLTDPDRYEEIVGGDLAAFVFSSADAVQIRTPAALARLIDRIEQL